MNIVYVSGSTYPSTTANSVQVVQQSNALSSTFGDVLLLARCAYNTSSDAADNVRENYGVYEQVTLKLMKGGRWLPVKVSALLYPFWVARRTMRRTPLVYGRHLAGLLIVALFKKPRTLVYECHSPPRGINTLILWFLCSLGYLRRIVVISDALSSILSAQFPYIKDIDMVVAHDGCDPMPALKMDKTNFTVGYVGAFYRGRGLELVAELAQRFSDVAFHVIGGNDKDFTTCTGLMVPSNITCHGRISPAELGSFYARFTVALAPYAHSIAVADGTDTVSYMSPLKIFEYMGWGKAIIASDLPVLHEVLDDGVNALFAKPEDVDSWEIALSRLREPALRNSLAVSAYEDAVLKHSWRARAMHVLRDISL